MWARGAAVDPALVSADTTDLQISYCFLDADPAETGEQLRGVLERRWADTGAVPLLAAPFHTLSPYDIGRHLP